MNLEQVKRADNPVFFCSFGKDSSCILHGLKEAGLLFKTLVIFIDCGGLYPDIVDFVTEARREIPKFCHIPPQSDIWDAIAQKGFPVDVEIAELGRWGREIAADPLAATVRTRPWTDCVYERFWAPMQAAISLVNPDVVITGERKQDRPYANDWLTRNGGAATVCRPLFDWTDDDVWAYVDRHQIPLSKSFQGRQKDRRDCWACMGGHDLTPAKIVELRRDWPDIYRRYFVDMGFEKVIPAMIRHMQQKTQLLLEIQKVVEQ